MIDLHTHSNISDGMLSPTALVERAEKIGLTAIALTDHDTVDGIPEAIEAAQSLTVRLIPGIEISAELPRGTMHIVGLFIDAQNEKLHSTLKWLVDVRQERNHEMVRRLNESGRSVGMDELMAVAGDGVLGRPHFAQLLVSKGYATSVDDAFTRFLGAGCGIYVPKKRLEPAEAIALVREAGGVPILAHPEQTRRRGDALDELVRELAEQGLAGMEVHCTGYSKRQVRRLSRVAEKHGLVLSGGSDFHGQGRSQVRLGYGIGDLRVPDELMEPIERLAGTHSLRDSQGH